MPDAWQCADPAKLADATAPDWPAVLAELRGALAAVGHPAGEGTS